MSDWIDKVHALADGELEGTEKDEALHTVASDPRAAAEHEWAVFLKGHLRDKLAPVHDEESWQACRARLDAIDKTRKTEAFVGRYAWVLCLFFLVGIFSAAAINRMGGSRLLSNDHVAGLFNGLTPLDVTESGQALERVRNNVGNAPRHLVRVARVVSVSIGIVDGRRAANMILDDGKTQMNLVVVAGTSGIEGLNFADSGYRCGMINDSRAVSWTDSGYLFLLLGSRSHEELLGMADQIRNAR